MTNSYDWFENAVLISTPMKTGGTLFSELLDGNKEMFVFPDIPYFFLLTQRKCVSQKHMVMDWILGSKFIGQQPETELFNFDRNNEYVPIPQGYIDLPFCKIKLQGYLRGIENWKDHFSFDIYHNQLLEALEKINQEGKISPKEIIRQTVLAAIKAIRNKNYIENKRSWAFRSDQTPTASLISKSQLQNNDIQDFISMFPRGKILFTVRSPHGTMASRKGHVAFVEQRKKYNFFKKLYYTMQDASIINNTYEMLISFLSSYGLERVKVIRYEDLCTNTEDIMRNICEFIGISFSPNVTLPTIINQRSKVITARKIDGNIVDKSRIIAWKNELTKFEIILVEAFIFNNRKKIKKLWNYETYCFPVTSFIFRWIFILPSLPVLRVLGVIHAKRKRIIQWALSLPQGSTLQAGGRNCDDKKYQVLPELYKGVNLYFIEKEADKYIDDRKLKGYDKVLDVGAHHGFFFTRALAKHNRNVCAMEPDGRALEMAKKYFKTSRATNISICRDSLEKHFPEQPYDLIFIRSALHNGPLSLRANLKKVASILASNGALYITYFGFGQQIGNLIYDLRDGNWHRILRRSAQTVISFIQVVLLSWFDKKPNYITAKQFRFLLEEAGFKVISIGATEFCLDNGMPGKIASFIREHEVICKKC